MSVDNHRPVVRGTTVDYPDREHHVPFAGARLENVHVLIVSKGDVGVIDFRLQRLSIDCNRFPLKALRLERVSTAQERLGRARDHLDIR